MTSTTEDMSTDPSTSSPFTEGIDVLYLSKLPSNVDRLVGIYLTITGILATVGNGLVLVLLFRKRGILKPLDVLVFNLALSDLGMAVLGYPFSAAAAYRHMWYVGKDGCNWYGFAGSLFSYVGMYTMTILAFLRYVKICIHNKVHWINKRNVNIGIMISWIFAMVWSVFPLLGWNRYKPEPFGISCTVHWDSRKVSDIMYIVGIFFFCYILPLAVTVFSYASIMRRIRVNRRIQAARRDRRIHPLEHEITKIGILVSLFFVIAWTPYAVVSLWGAITESKNIPLPVMTAPALFAKFANVYNPIIFYIFNKTFRTDVNKLVCRCGCKCFNVTINVSENGDRETTRTTAPSKAKALFCVNNSGVDALMSVDSITQPTNMAAADDSAEPSTSQLMQNAAKKHPQSHAKQEVDDSGTESTSHTDDSVLFSPPPPAPVVTSYISHILTPKHSHNVNGSSVTLDPCRVQSIDSSDSV